MQPESRAGLFGRHRPLFLHDLQIPAALRVAVLAPHPDDFDAIGVTMRHFRDNGNWIDVVVLTSGASGVEDGFNGAFTAEAKAALREDEQRSSCRYFGLPEDRLVFLRLDEDESGHPADSLANLGLVRSYLRAKKPEFVFMPHGNDSNAGHRRTCALFRQIASAEGFSIIAFYNRDPKTLAMREDLYTVFGIEAANWKGQLLRFHESQQKRNLNVRHYGFDERILRMNRQSAEESGKIGSYAEVFELECFGPRE